MKKSISLRSLFAVSFVSIIAVLIIVISSIISFRTTEEYKNQIGNMLSQTSFQMADKLDHYMWSRYGEVSILSKLETLSKTDNKDSIRNLLEELKKTIPAYSWIGLIDTKGNVVSSTGGILEGVDISSRPVYKEALKEPFIGDVHEAVLLAKLLPNPTGETMKFVDISIPIKDSNGNLKNILATHLSWEWAKEIEDSIAKPLKNKNDLELFVISSDNTILLGPKDMLGQKVNLESVTNARKGENSWSVETWQDGKKYLTGYAAESGYKNYKGLGWTILVRQPLDIAYEPVEKLKSFIIIIGVLLSGVFAMIGWVIAGLIAKPLQNITYFADKLRLGHKVEIPKYNGIKDIEILSESLSSLIRSLTKTENALGNMEEIANRDHLTNLPNRVALDNYLKNIKEKNISENLTYGIFCLDLDGFKLINDTYGHDMGDLILKEVANRLNNNIEKDEIVARIGGDEFVVLKNMNFDSFVEDSKNFANSLIEEIRNPYLIQGIKMNVGCSIGGAFYPLDGDDPMEVIKLADKYLYESKRAGKNRYTCGAYNKLS